MKVVSYTCYFSTQIMVQCGFFLVTVIFVKIIKMNKENVYFVNEGNA